jgi:hypothetical protein
VIWCQRWKRAAFGNEQDGQASPKRHQGAYGRFLFLGDLGQLPVLTGGN